MPLVEFCCRRYARRGGFLGAIEMHRIANGGDVAQDECRRFRWMRLDWIALGHIKRLCRETCKCLELGHNPVSVWISHARCDSSQCSCRASSTIACAASAPAPQSVPADGVRRLAVLTRRINQSFRRRCNSIGSMLPDRKARCRLP
jgi:hypothetical protein